MLHPNARLRTHCTSNTSVFCDILKIHIYYSGVHRDCNHCKVPAEKAVAQNPYAAFYSADTYVDSVASGCSRKSNSELAFEMVWR